MLDFAYEVRDDSLLSCQINVTDELDRRIVLTPEKQTSVAAISRTLTKEAGTAANIFSDRDL